MIPIIKSIWLGSGSGDSESILADGPGPRPELNHASSANDPLKQFEHDQAHGRIPSGNGWRELWGCVEPPSISLRLRPTANDQSLGSTYSRGRTHAKALAPLGDARRPRLAAVPEPLVFACPSPLKDVRNKVKSYEGLKGEKL